MASDPRPGNTARSSLVARDETQACGPDSHLRINRKLPHTSVLKTLGCLHELPPSLEEEVCTEPMCECRGEGGLERHPNLSVGGPEPRGQDLSAASVRSLEPG